MSCEAHRRALSTLSTMMEVLAKADDRTFSRYVNNLRSASMNSSAGGSDTQARNPSGLDSRAGEEHTYQKSSISALEPTDASFEDTARPPQAISLVGLAGLADFNEWRPSLNSNTLRPTTRRRMARANGSYERSATLFESNCNTPCTAPLSYNPARSFQSTSHDAENQERTAQSARSCASMFEGEGEMPSPALRSVDKPGRNKCTNVRFSEYNMLWEFKRGESVAACQ
jgi:hypothetical protein